MVSLSTSQKFRTKQRKCKFDSVAKIKKKDQSTLLKLGGEFENVC